MWQNSNTKGHRQILSYTRLDRSKMSVEERDRKYKAFQLMGMKCWKCHKEIGALVTPDYLTPEQFGVMLVALKVMPVCTDCIETNPRYVSGQNLIKGK